MLHENNLHVKALGFSLKCFLKQTSAKTKTEKLKSSEKSSNINLIWNEIVKYTKSKFKIVRQVARLGGIRDEYLVKIKIICQI